MREEGRVHVGRRRWHVGRWHHRRWQPVGWHAGGSRTRRHPTRRVRRWLRHWWQRVQTWRPLPFVGHRWRAPVVGNQRRASWSSQGRRGPSRRGHAQEAGRWRPRARGNRPSRGRGPLQVGWQRRRRPRLGGRRPQGRGRPRGVHLRGRGPAQPHRGRRRVVGCVLGRWWCLSDEWGPHRGHAPLVGKGAAPLRAALRGGAPRGPQPSRGGPPVASATHVVVRLSTVTAQLAIVTT